MRLTKASNSHFIEPRPTLWKENGRGRDCEVVVETDGLIAYAKIMYGASFTHPDRKPRLYWARVITSTEDEIVIEPTTLKKLRDDGIVITQVEGGVRIVRDGVVVAPEMKPSG